MIAYTQVIIIINHYICFKQNFVCPSDFFGVILETRTAVICTTKTANMIARLSHSLEYSLRASFTFRKQKCSKMALYFDSSTFKWSRN